MAIECAYSFADLFKAAHQKEPAEQELEDLYTLPQDQINKIVKEWATKAAWEIDQRTGSDGKLYYAFAPKFN